MVPVLLGAAWLAEPAFTRAGPDGLAVAAGWLVVAAAGGDGAGLEQADARATAHTATASAPKPRSAWRPRLGLRDARSARCVSGCTSEVFIWVPPVMMRGDPRVMAQGCAWMRLGEKGSPPHLGRSPQPTDRRYRQILTGTVLTNLSGDRQ